MASSRSWSRWALAAPPTAEQLFVSADSAMLSIRTFVASTSERPEAALRIELLDHGPTGVLGVRLKSADADVTHEPPDEPDAILVTTTDAFLAAFGNDDLAGLVADGAVIIGDPEVVRHLIAGVRVPAATEKYSNRPVGQGERVDRL